MQDNSSKHSTAKRYATVAIILGGGAIAGGAYIANQAPKNYGVPFSYNGQQYYIQDDSRRALYSSLEECLADVPPEKQDECEAVSDYHGTSHSYYGFWYGPIYSPRDSAHYRPSSQYATEPADSSNFGKKFPSTANAHGFGATGKALTHSSGS